MARITFATVSTNDEGELIPLRYMSAALVVRIVGVAFFGSWIFRFLPGFSFGKVRFVPRVFTKGNYKTQAYECEDLY